MPGLTSRKELLARVLLPLPIASWVVYRFLAGERRWEFVIFLLLPPALALGGPRARKLLYGLYPLALLALLYDAMRFVKNVGVTPERLHICDLRALDSRWFGFGLGPPGSTLHDWLQAHATPFLDAYFAIPYGTFLEVTVVFAVYLYVKDYRAMQRFGWTFFLVNLAGFITYHLYPAAPPWYFHSHGCVADLAAHASEGPNLARVDARMGLAYFHGFYGRSSDVFGAVPSLHVAYPLLIMIHGWPRFRALGRAATVLFFVSMCLAAVYLDHHWVIDVLLGISYTLVVHRLVVAFTSRGGPPHGAIDPKDVPAPRPATTRTRAAFLLATWFGCGRFPRAPGTAGTIGALPLYFVVRPLGPPAIWVTAIVVTAVGVWAASVVAAETGGKDPQMVVIDEVAGVLLTLAASPFGLVAVLASVLFFRLFDQLKPWPAHVAERLLPSGWGIVFDDVFAGLWGALAMTFLANVGAF